MNFIDFDQAALCLKTIANPHRLAIIHLLIERGSVSVGELAKDCKLQSHVASEHLSLLKDRGFLECRREGRCTLYTIKEPALLHIMECIKKKFTIT